MPTVSAKIIHTYDPALLKEAMAFHLQSLQIFDKLTPGMRVVIKPNLLMARRPDAAITTHPAVVRALCEVLRENDITDITIAESSGGPHLQKYMENTYAACGYNALTDVAKLNLDMDFVSVKPPEGSLVPAFNIIKPIAEADFVINVCKLKTHGMTQFSAGMKNLFGCVPGLQKPEMHYRFPGPEQFCRMICELDQLVNPGLTIIDAIDCMEGNGPSGGNIRHYGALLASADMYAMDNYVVGLMGMNADELDMLRQARNLGLLTDAPVDLIGDILAPADPPFKLPDSKKLDFMGHVPTFLQPIAKKFLTKVLKPIPRIHTETCVGCGKCAESCPMQIITIESKKAGIRDKKACISCFCCQEMCPVRAISVKRHIRNL